MLLPTASELSAYTAARSDPQHWEPMLETLAKRHGLSLPIRLLPTGSAVVAAFGESHILKVLPPFWAHEAEAEAVLLQAIADQLSIATPLLYAHEEVAGWHYLLMEMLPGTPLQQIWPHLDGSNRRYILQQLAEVCQELHILPIPKGIAGWPQRLQEDWQQWNHRLQTSMPSQELQAHLESYLSPQLPILAKASPLGIVHADINPEHLLVYQQNGRWELCGLFDLGDAFAGPAPYEYLSPLLTLDLSPQEQQLLMPEAMELLPWLLLYPHWSSRFERHVQEAACSADPVAYLQHAMYLHA